MPTVFVRSSRRPEIEALIRQIPAMMEGRVPDTYGIVRGFKLRVAFGFFSIIKENFIIKSRGGTDEAGIRWRPLSPEYLAYVRPMASAPGRGSRSPPRAGGRSPGDNDGFMNAKQLKRWRGIYAGLLKYLALQMDLGTAKAIAAATAWKRLKAEGVRTKLEVFGRRDVEILRDRGILFNSLSPGVITFAGPDASYSPPTDEGGEYQVVEQEDGSLTCGTNVEYAARQFATRPAWPPGGELPDIWLAEIAEIGASGLMQIGELFT